MLKKETAKTILVISHSGFISDIVTILLKLPMKDNRYFRSYFCAISYFELNKDFEVKNYFINYTNHLLIKEVAENLIE